MFKKICFLLIIIPLFFSCKKDSPAQNVITTTPVNRGRYVLFDADEAFNQGLSNSPSPFTSIYYTNLDGSGLTRVTGPEVGYYSYRPSWAPNGKSILYIRGNQTDTYRSLCSINLNGTNFRSLVQGNKVDYPSYSYDGTKLIYAKSFVGSPPYQADVYTADTTGANEQKITSFAADNGSVSNIHCSSDGRIYFYGFSQHLSPGVYSVMPDGSDLKFAIYDVDFLGISPDGKYILYDLSTGLYICNNDGTNNRTVIAFNSTVPNMLAGAAWSPDDSEIYLSNADYPANFGMYSVTAQGYGLQQFAAGYYELPQVF
jgi:Tol biopolymer transport system component